MRNISAVDSAPSHALQREAGRWQGSCLGEDAVGRRCRADSGDVRARLLFAAALGLGIDESYMVAAGRKLQLSYFDHPPIAWWMAWGVAHLTGSESALRRAAAIYRSLRADDIPDVSGDCGALRPGSRACGRRSW